MVAKSLIGNRKRLKCPFYSSAHSGMQLTESFNRQKQAQQPSIITPRMNYISFVAWLTFLFVFGIFFNTNNLYTSNLHDAKITWFRNFVFFESFDCNSTWKWFLYNLILLYLANDRNFQRIYDVPSSIIFRSQLG